MKNRFTGVGNFTPTPYSNNSNSSFNVALFYSQMFGWAVFPLHSIVDGRCTCNKKCSSPGKHPKIFNGLNAASADLEVIKSMDWKNSNIGIATGAKSGFFVIDVDGKEGMETLERLQKQHGKLPTTVQQITGSGGRHIFFKYRGEIRNKVNFLPGLDIRGDGGYIVASPSIHVSGNKYKWELSSHPLKVKISEPPVWLMQMLVETKNKSFQNKSSSYWVNIFKGVNKGHRNNAAASLAGYLFRRYVDPYLVVEILHLWNERNNPPLTKKELNTVIDSIAGKELRRRRGEM